MRNSVNILEIVPKEINEGTSVENYAFDLLKGEYGYLKITGCMPGINHEDLREKVAMTILKTLGFMAADVELFEMEDNTPAWMSYDLLGKDEIAVEIDYTSPHIDSINSEDIFIAHMEELENKILMLPDITNEEVSFIKKRMIEIILMSLLLDNYDFKKNNTQICYNKISKKYKDVMCYDYGVAFAPDAIQKNWIFSKLTKEEVFYNLFKFYGNELSPLVSKINELITAEYIDKTLEECEALEISSIKDGILDNLVSMNALANYFNNNKQNII